MVKLVVRLSYLSNFETTIFLRRVNQCNVYALSKEISLIGCDIVSNRFRFRDTAHIRKTFITTFLTVITRLFLNRLFGNL